MSKNKSGSFQNYAAKKFGMIERVDQYSEKEIYDILRDELGTILGQISATKTGGKYPDYATNMFANVSAAKFVYEFVQIWDKQIRKHGESDMMSADDVKAFRRLIGDAYIHRDKFLQSRLDEKDRNKLLLKTYAMLDPIGVKTAKKLKLKKRLCIELALLIRQPAKYSIDRVGKLFDMSTVSQKKKLKILQKLTRKSGKFAEYIGAALTINKSITDFVGMAYDVVMPKKETKRKKLTKKMMKRRMPYLRAYATVFKKRKSYNTILTDGTFYQKNKKLIKKLIEEDLGFKKAFRVLKRGGSAGSKQKGLTDKKPKTHAVDRDMIERKAKELAKKRAAAAPENVPLANFLEGLSG